MPVRNQDGLDSTPGDQFEIWQRVVAGVGRVHPAIEDQLMAADFKIIAVRADLRAPGQIDEFQGVKTLKR